MSKINYYPKLKKTIRKRNLALTEKQRKDIWDRDGPYSEAYLIIETRILNDEVYRVWVKVEALINPFTFKFIRKHQDAFADNHRIQTILKWAAYKRREKGYISHVFSAPFDKGVFKMANKILHETEEAIIKMHIFMMNHFDININ